MTHASCCDKIIHVDVLCRAKFFKMVMSHYQHVLYRAVTFLNSYHLLRSDLPEEKSCTHINILYLSLTKILNPPLELLIEDTQTID